MRMKNVINMNKTSFKEFVPLRARSPSSVGRLLVVKWIRVYPSIITATSSSKSIGRRKLNMMNDQSKKKFQSMKSLEKLDASVDDG